MKQARKGLLVLAVLLLSVTTAWIGPGAASGTCDPNYVTLEAASGSVRYSVELADDPHEQARGLMFRPSLPSDHGMLFVFEPPRPASFWMRNTMISLDMIFITDAGIVESVATDTIPFSERTWRSVGPVRAVLEVNAGQSVAHGIASGTLVRHPAFLAAEGAHSCAGTE